ncbi:MAG: DUF928 domain-containing protein [Myxococcota bacterium]
MRTTQRVQRTRQAGGRPPRRPASSRWRRAAGAVATLAGLVAVLTLSAGQAARADAAGETAGKATPPRASTPAGASPEAKASGSAAPERRAPRYTPPPDRGTPERRVGGATRRAAPLPELVALGPDHLGRTREPAPTLFWLASADSDARLEFSLMRKRDASQLDQVLVRTIAPRVRRGIGSLSLAELGVELEPGVVYRWYVAAVIDPDKRARDVVAGAALERVSEMQAEILPGVEAADIYAREGFWYDAFGAVQLGLADRPETTRRVARLESARRSLLSQVGIPPSDQ